jgi:hypothetical protein
VGRAALDEEAIRLIEQHNPEIEFNWTRILKGEAGEPPPPAGRRDRAERRRRDESRGPQPGARRPEPPVEGGRPSARIAAADSTAEPATPPEPVEPEIEAPADFAREDSALLEGIPDDVAAPEPLVFDETGEALAEGAAESPERPAAEHVTAAQARLGSEGVLRLRARYAEVLARISERVADSVRAAELKSQAERLNPDTWVTADEVSRGLEEYEAVFESLRAVVGRNRKRRRRGRGAPVPAAPAPPHKEEPPHKEADAHEEDRGTEEP